MQRFAKPQKPSLFNAIKRIGILETGMDKLSAVVATRTREIWIDHLRTTGAVLGHCGLIIYLLHG